MIGMERIPYPTDLTDNEWHLIEPLLPALVFVIATPLLGGRFLPAFTYPVSWR